MSDWLLDLVQTSGIIAVAASSLYHARAIHNHHQLIDRIIAYLEREREMRP